MIHQPRYLHRRFMVLLAVVAAVGAGAARAQDEGGEQPWPAVFRDTTDVSVVNVDVVVTDRDGRPVSGLGREDFELLLDGAAVAISNFYAVEGGQVLRATPAEAPAAEAAAPEEPEAQEEERRLYLGVFIDNPNITSNHRARIFSRLRELLLAHHREDVHVTLAAPAATAAGLEVVGSSDVPHEVFAALDELEGETVAINVLEQDLRQIVRELEAIPLEGGLSFAGFKGKGLDAVDKDDTDEATDTAEQLTALAIETLLPQIRSYSQRKFDQVRQSLSSLERMVDLLAGLPGRKALLYVSDGLPMRSGEALFESYAHRLQAIQSSTGGYGAVSAESEVARYDASQLFSDLMARSNGARVSFYTLDAGPPAAAQRGSAEAGTAVHLAGFEAVGEGNRQSSLSFMAQETGGRVALGNAALENVLEGIFNDFDNHYSLGFIATEKTADRSKKLEVRVLREGLTVRHRNAWRPRTPAQRMAENTLAALLKEDHKNPLGIVLEAREPTLDEGGNVVVPLLVEIPLGRLVLLPEETEHQARVSLYVAARDERGRMSEVARHLCPIRVPNSEILVALGRSMVCGVRLALRTGRQTVAVVVHDEIADVVASTSLKVDVRKPPATAAKAKVPEGGSGR